MSCNICSVEVAHGSLGNWMLILHCQQVETNSILNGFLERGPWDFSGRLAERVEASSTGS